MAQSDNQVIAAQARAQELQGQGQNRFEGSQQNGWQNPSTKFNNGFNGFQLLSPTLEKSAIGQQELQNTLKLNSSEINGVAGKLKKDLNNLVFYGDKAHQLNLATNKLFDKFDIIDNIKHFAYNLHGYFKYSSRK